MDLARVNIVEPNGVRRSIPVNPAGSVIGRDPNNEIVIGYERASRYHAQIDFDGQRYYITDLGSTNGTYLGNSQLPPNQPTEWNMGVPARIGEIYFNLELPQHQQEEMVGSMETMAGYDPAAGSQAQSSGAPWLWIGGGGLLLLCGCAVVAIAGFFMFGG